MKPVVEWRVMTEADIFGPKDRPKSKYDIIWDGNPDSIKLSPESYSLCGGLKAFVGDQNIGEIALGETHLLNHPRRIWINSFSMFFPKKKNGGYGKEFGDVEDWQTRQITKRFDLEAAKAYVEKPFFDFCDKAKLVWENNDASTSD